MFFVLVFLQTVSQSFSYFEILTYSEVTKILSQQLKRLICQTWNVGVTKSKFQFTAVWHFF